MLTGPCSRGSIHGFFLRPSRVSNFLMNDKSASVSEPLSFTSLCSLLFIQQFIWADCCCTPGVSILNQSCNLQLHWCTQTHNWEAIICLYSLVENMIATLVSTTKAVLLGYGLKRHSWTDGPVSLSSLTDASKGQFLCWTGPLMRSHDGSFQQLTKMFESSF